jgi:hypothetical protein
VSLPPWTVMLAASVAEVPPPQALRGGAQYDLKMDGFLH